MKNLQRVLNNPDKYQVTPKAIDELRQLYKVFEANPFFRFHHIHMLKEC